MPCLRSSITPKRHGPRPPPHGSYETKVKQYAFTLLGHRAIDAPSTVARDVAKIYINVTTELTLISRMLITITQV